jgi:hypothetical protein
MQGAFIQALTYCPPVILGRQMRPFSCWHGLMLEAMGNAYLGGTKPGVSDVVAGAWVCALSSKDGLAFDGKAIVAWGRKTRNVASAIAQLQDYIDAGLRCPEYWRKAEDKPVKAPYWWHLALFARQHLGLDEAAAWDEPVARLVCYRACNAEQEGWKNLKSDNEMKAKAALEK